MPDPVRLTHEESAAIDAEIHWGDNRLFRVLVNCGFCESYEKARAAIKLGAVSMLKNPPQEGLWPTYAKATDPNAVVENGVYALRVGRQQRRVRIWNGIEEINVTVRR